MKSQKMRVPQFVECLGKLIRFSHGITAKILTNHSDTKIYWIRWNSQQFGNWILLPLAVLFNPKRQVIYPFSSQVKWGSEKVSLDGLRAGYWPQNLTKCSASNALNEMFSIPLYNSMCGDCCGPGLHRKFQHWLIWMECQSSFVLMQH